MVMKGKPGSGNCGLVMHEQIIDYRLFPPLPAPPPLHNTPRPSPPPPRSLVVLQARPPT